MRLRTLLASASVATVALAAGVPSGGSATPASGAKLWTKRYTFSGSGTDSGNAVAASPDGARAFVVGSSDGGSATHVDYLTIGYDAATGAQSWAKRYDGPGHGDDYAYAVAVSPDGSKVFVTGRAYGNATKLETYATVAYDAVTGRQLWSARYNGPENGDDEASDVAVSGDGSKVFVTGASFGGAGHGTDYATIAYDASTGTQLWVQRYDGTGSSSDNATGVAVSTDGTKVFVTGETYGLTTDFNYGTVAYDSRTGRQLWSKRYDGPARDTDRARAVTVGPGGTVFVTGDSDGGRDSHLDDATIAYDPSTGTQLWASRFDGAAHDDDYAFVVAASGSKVFVAGRTYADPAAGADYGTIAYSATTGAKLWSRTYDGPGSRYDAAYAIGVDATGTKVFVTGDSYGDNTTDYDGATFAYDAATGAKLWGSRYNGPGSNYDGFYGLAVAGGQVFVTGSGYGGATTGNDAATRAYQG